MTAHSAQSGIVEAIHIVTESGADPEPRQSVTAIAAHGLEGSHYATMCAPDITPRHKQVTLIEMESIEAIRRESDISIDVRFSRRNIAVRGVALNHLVDRNFHVGDVELRGVELCEPCKGLERMTDTRGICAALVHRGGLRAEVIHGGTIAVGDALTAAQEGKQGR